ncbi:MULTISPECIES: PepSY domain-containing protein [Chryseobacterium]|uniref:Iron-regulated membrane protein n=1 Tax=Chryseobacterium geocarposphaerae TaxID=1416776 RepID=A0ABU1LF07_9FLAO|nr:MULTISPECIES: PepSY-associated TM helix domain-containing protein [Chryseobacterium]MDR6405135.1 putative iron-regulated membrane protein [Chryseobacterium geocarposphaerae]MDR6697918.1 putative iron-regulated membrane protein [Chryseobacterium ginsenosidimutans]
MRKKHHHKKKPSFTKKWSAKLHLWFGLSIGIIVFIVSLTGTMYVFKDEIQGALRKDAIYVKAETITQKPLSIETLREKVALEINEKYPISSVEIPLDKNKSYEFLYYEKDKKSWNYFDEVKINKLIYVNPYTGEILGIYNEKYDLFPILKAIHWSLLLKADWGKYVVGIPVILFIIMLITGIILWWPKSKKTAKGRFWFNWENVKNWKRKNYDLHRILGFYASFIALLLSLSGIYFAFPWVKNAFNFTLSGSVDLPKEKEIKSPDSLLTKNNSVFDLTAQETRKLYAGSSSFRIPLNGKNKKGKELKNIPVIVYGENGKFAIRNQIVFDKYSGKLLSNKPHQELNNAEKYANANYDIHTGSYFGLVGKIIWFITGLICTSLPITGFLVWLGKKKKGIKTLS